MTSNHFIQKEIIHITRTKNTKKSTKITTPAPTKSGRGTRTRGPLVRRSSLLPFAAAPRPMHNGARPQRTAIRRDKRCARASWPCPGPAGLCACGSLVFQLQIQIVKAQPAVFNQQRSKPQRRCGRTHRYHNEYGPERVSLWEVATLTA